MVASAAMENVIKRGLSYYVRVVVPAPLRAVIGKREFVVALGTRDLGTAKRAAHGHLTSIHAQLQAAKLHQEYPQSTPEFIQQAARQARESILRGQMDEGAAAVAFDATVENHLERLRAKHGVDEEGDPKVSDTHVRAVRLAHKLFKGETAALLSHQIDQYITEVTPAVRAQTVQDKKRVYSELRKWLGGDSEVSAITRKVAGSYLSTVLAKQGKAPKTLRSELAQLSALWRYMLGRGVVESNVWTLMSTTLPTSKRGGADGHRRPWTEAELIRFFKETPTTDPMWATAALSLYGGGMRLEEVTRLKVSDFIDGALHVREAKSGAGVRAVPVHPVIMPLVKRLAATSTDTYLLPGLLIAGRDAKRSVYLSKRCAYHIRKVLKIADKHFVMHGLRHTFTNACEKAAIPLTTAQLLVGHSRRHLC